MALVFRGALWYNGGKEKGRDFTARFCVDQDYHIHSHLSLCSSDPGQTQTAIREILGADGFTDLCLTDHYWDERVCADISDWYRKQDTAHLLSEGRTESGNGVRFRFGAEVDMTMDHTVGISDEMAEKLDFIIVPTTHLHMKMNIDQQSGAEERAQAWIDRFDALLRKDLPFEKIGLAHITCTLIRSKVKNGHLEVLRLIDDETMRQLFSETAKKGMGVELNFDPDQWAPEFVEENLRPYRIAKACGCKFYFGGDAHTRDELKENRRRFEHTVDLLDLIEDDRFVIPER